MLSFKRIGESRWVQTAAGLAAAEYLRLVWKTNRVIFDPPDIYDRIEPELPVILAMWHGQHFLVPFVRRNYPGKVLVSRHRDGEINAIAAERLGVEAIRGSGDHGRRFDRKGGVSAFMQMISALEQGYTMALTADVPKVSRVVGRGIIMLAKQSGRSIFPGAVATSRRIELKNWDRSAINLPFGRAAVVLGESVRVPKDADETMLETCRLRLQESMNAATTRAYALVDRGQAGSSRG